MVFLFLNFLYFPIIYYFLAYFVTPMLLELTVQKDVFRVPRNTLIGS